MKGLLLIETLLVLLLANAIAWIVVAVASPLPALAAASRLEDANDGQPVGHA